MSAAVVIIDVQEALVAGAFQRAALIANINGLIRQARAADVIAHHNALLANVVHPRRRIRVLAVADIDL